MNRLLVLPLLKDSQVKLHNLRSKRAGKPFSAVLVMECREDGSPHFRFEFEKKEGATWRKNDGRNI